MKTREKKVTKWFWPWQDQKQEEWFRQMSKAGWHLYSIGLGGLQFNFVEGEKQDFVYQLDFRQERDDQMEDYLDLFENAGWEHVLSWNGWQHFRKPVEKGEEEQIFTDNQSKVEKYKRVLVKFSLVYPGFMIVFLANLDKYPPWFAALLVFVFVALTLYVGTSLLMITLRIRQLEREE